MEYRGCGITDPIANRCESVPTCNPTDKTERNFVSITQDINEKVEVITNLSEMILDMFYLQGDPEPDSPEPPTRDLTDWAEKTEYKLDTIVLILKHALARIKG